MTHVATQKKDNTFHFKKIVDTRSDTKKDNTFQFKKIVDTRSDTKKDNTYDFKKIVDKRRDTKKDKTRKQKRLKPSISTPWPSIAMHGPPSFVGFKRNLKNLSAKMDVSLKGLSYLMNIGINSLLPPAQRPLGKAPRKCENFRKFPENIPKFSQGRLLRVMARSIIGSFFLSFYAVLEQKFCHSGKMT